MSVPFGLPVLVLVAVVEDGQEPDLLLKGCEMCGSRIDCVDSLCAFIVHCRGTCWQGLQRT